MRKLIDKENKAVSGRIILSVTLTLTLVLTLGITPVPAYGAQGSDFTVTCGTPGTDYTYGADGVLTFAVPGDYTVSMVNPGTPTATDKIAVDAFGSSAEDPVNIILDNVEIDVSGTTGACAFEVRSGSTAGLTLSE